MGIWKFHRDQISMAAKIEKAVRLVCGVCTDPDADFRSPGDDSGPHGDDVSTLTSGSRPMVRLATLSNYIL